MVGRLVLYLGAMYVLAAFISLSRSARRTGISLEEMLSRFFDELEAGYKSLIETATDAIVVFDSLNRVIIWNPTAEKMFGYSPSEAVGSFFVQLVIPEEYADSLSCNPGSSLNPETDSAAQNPLDIIVRRKDLSTFPAEITLSRHRVAGSWVCTCIIRDLTECKRAETTIRESEDRLRFVLETCHTGAWDLDLIDYTAFWSPEYDLIFGYLEMLPQWIYETFLDHVISEDRPDMDTKFCHAIETRVDWNFECRIRRIDDEIRWILAVGRHRDGSSGRLSRMAGIVQDITGRKRAEEVVRQSEEKFRVLFTRMTEGSALRELVYDASGDPVGYRSLLSIRHLSTFSA